MSLGMSYPAPTMSRMAAGMEFEEDRLAAREQPSLAAAPGRQCAARAQLPRTRELRPRDPGEPGVLGGMAYLEQPWQTRASYHDIVTWSARPAELL